MQDVITHIQELIRLHTELLELSKQKKQWLIDNKIDELSKIVTLETKWTKQIAEHEQAWIAAAHHSIRQRGITLVNPTMTMSDFIKLTLHTEDKNRLSGLQRDLQQVVQELQEVHLLNQELLQHSLQFINYSLDLFTAAPEDEATYSRPERPSAGSGHRGLFDTKA